MKRWIVIETDEKYYSTTLYLANEQEDGSLKTNTDSLRCYFPESLPNMYGKIQSLLIHKATDEDVQPIQPIMPEKEVTQ